MLFNYTAIDGKGSELSGSIDAINMEVAISSLQRRGFVIKGIDPADKKSIFEMEFNFLNPIRNKDVVILSRQVATLFEAQVSALRVFRLLAGETTHPKLREHLTQIADDLQGGSPISDAMAKHEKVFAKFYVSMVRAGEESGKLDETFQFLADHLDRSYEVTTKARNALVYPAFVITVFIVVMVLMLTLVIPRISQILIDAGGDIPIYTKIVIAVSNFFVNFGVFLLILMAIGSYFLWRYAKTEEGMRALSQLKLSVPYVGDLYKKLYLSRVADNFSTMLSSGVSMVRTVEITASVVDNKIYEDLINDAAQSIRAGMPASEALSRYPEFPGVMVQMIKVGEETGELGNILKVLGNFYRREVTNAVDTLVGLIEPLLIVALGLGVGILLTSVLLPIYNIASTI
jgi:type IV pilus assembly protein PilC